MRLETATSPKLVSAPPIGVQAGLRMTRQINQTSLLGKNIPCIGPCDSRLYVAGHISSPPGLLLLVWPIFRNPSDQRLIQIQVLGLPQKSSIPQKLFPLQMKMEPPKKSPRGDSQQANELETHGWIWTLGCSTPNKLPQINVGLQISWLPPKGDDSMHGHSSAGRFLILASFWLPDQKRQPKG